MLWIVVVLLAGLPIMLSNAGVETLINGLGGITGDFSSLFSGSGIMVALSFGIPTTIGLLSGTFGDQMFWQRVFCVKADKVKQTMIAAAVIFAVVPISLSVFGFIASGAGLCIADTQLVNVGAVIAFCPKWFLYLFFVLILAGLISTVDSIICAVSSVAGHDVSVRAFNTWIKKFEKKEKISWVLEWAAADGVGVARVSMIAVTIVAVLIANIPGLTILYLFLLYGTLRSSVMLPTVFAILGKRMTERGMFYGILTSMVVGLPVFAYGNLVGNIPLIVAGSLFTILASGLIALDYKRETVILNRSAVFDASGTLTMKISVQCGDAKKFIQEVVNDFSAAEKAICKADASYRRMQDYMSKTGLMIEIRQANEKVK